MMIKTIQILKRNVTHEQAVAQFQGRKFGSFSSSLFYGPLCSIADAYIPFKFFRVEIHNKGRQQYHWLAIDAVEGLFDLYFFHDLPSQDQLLEVKTRNYPQALLPLARIEEMLLDRVRRHVYAKGFFHVRNLQMRAELAPVDIYVPYWIGLFGQKEKVSLSVIDAVRRRFEGAKVRNFFHSWLST
jgi:hypothetical protein